MSRVLTVGFEFQDIFYYSLIRVKELAGETEYQITIMNEKLQTVLSGNDILKEKDGHLKIQIPESGNLQDLKIKVAEALSTLLDMPLEKELMLDKFY
ncbi:MAG: hypothetical protein WKF89_11720 [Chitinophagaceae bacterium]